MILFAAISILAPVAGAAAKSPALATGFADTAEYLAADPGQRGLWLDRTREAGASIVRLNLKWSAIATANPDQPANPADPAYDFERLDAGVRDARSRGLTVLLTVRSAPAWAEGQGRPGNVQKGTWRPQPAALRRFARALAQRYSGSFTPAGDLTPLPRVRHYQAWNEPNLSAYLTPQYSGKKPRSPGIYRGMLNAFYGGIHGVSAQNVVLSAGTAPYGEPAGGDRMRPVVFWRKLLCLKGREQLKRTRCPHPARMDIAAHHPINTSGGPGQRAWHPDDVSTPDLGRLTRVLRAARKHGTVRPAGRLPLWVTEFWFDSNPPDPAVGVPVRKHARWIADSLRRYWLAGASAAINLQIRDAPFVPAQAALPESSGIYFRDGTRKPAYRAYRFPLVAKRVSDRVVRIWLRSPVRGKVRIQLKRKGDWRTVATRRAGAGSVVQFSTSIRKRRSKRAVRAIAGGESSLVWTTLR